MPVTFEYLHVISSDIYKGTHLHKVPGLWIPPGDSVKRPLTMRKVLVSTPGYRISVIFLHIVNC